MTFDNVKALQEWANEHEPSDKLAFHKAWWSQIVDVRDKVPLAFGRGHHKDVVISVCSTHTSKSTVLPVYLICYRGVTIRMRANYYNWVISVQDYDIPSEDVFEFVGHFSTDDINPLYAEGFKPGWVFPHLDRKSWEYTFELPSFHWVFTFFYLLGKDYS